MTTGELIDALKQADPNGYRKVEASTNGGDKEVVDIIKGPPSELVPVVLVLKTQQPYRL